MYLKYTWILYFCYIFNKVTRFYVRFLRFNGFENVVSKIELYRSSLACTDTKHRTQYLNRFHSTSSDFEFENLVLALSQKQ